MKGKLAVLTGFGAGYVLGTRAGRARYEQIKSGASRLWQDPRVQQKKHEAADAVKHQGMAAKDKIQEKVQEKVHAHSGGTHAGTPSGNHSGNYSGNHSGNHSGTAEPTMATDSDPAHTGPRSPSWPA